MIKNKKGGGKVRKYAVITIFTFIFVLLACNAAAAADTSDNNSSISQMHEQIQNKSQLTTNQSNTTSQKISKNTTQLKNITITGKVERCNAGGPFSGVTITVRSNGTTLASTTTKKDGTYTVNFQSMYTLFQVTASSTGHNPSTKNVTITSSNNGNYYGTTDFKLGADNVYVDDSWAGYNNGRSVQFYDGTTHTIGSDAFDTISEGVTNVNAGGTIHIANGTYTGNGNRGITISRNFFIVGQSTNGTIIDAQSRNYIFLIQNGAITTISNLTFKNGVGNDGGAISNQGSLSVTNCTFTSNRASGSGSNYGGAIYSTGSLAVTESTFTSNTADDNGGAIYSTGPLTVTGSTFTSNTANYGGAIYTTGGTSTTPISVTDSAFTSNTASEGGAIYNTGTLSVTRSTFTSNTADNNGGAINSAGSLTVNNCTFTSNSGTYGGSIWTTGTLYVTGSTFSNNTASSDGGGISNGNGTTMPTGNVTVTNSTFTGNTATYGGAIWNHSTLNISNCTFTGNKATYGGALRNWGTLTATGSTFTGNTATTSGDALSNYLGTAILNFNRIIGNGANDINAESNGGTSTVNAENNWWGSNTGASTGRVTAETGASVDANPWIILKITASPTSILVGGTSTITADLTWNSNNAQPTGGHVPDGILVNFTGTLGSVSPVSASTVNGIATTTFTAGYTPGTATVNAVVDGVTVSTSITINPVANLQINQTVNTPVNVGNTVTYTVIVKNNGPNTATNIRIQDLIPAGFTATPSVGTFSNGIWTITSLASGSTATLTIIGTATSSMAGLTTSNTATELSQTEYTSQLPTSTAGVYTKKANVRLTQTTSSTPVNVGDTVTYTVTATNHGPDTATNINIQDIIPSGLTNVVVTPSAGTTYSNGVWTITSLANGGIVTLTIAGKAGADMAGLTTTNTATRTSQTEYNSESAASTSSGIYVKKANVVITNTANSSKLNVGQTGTFTVKVTNNGPDTATNIVINDPLPSGFTASVTGGTYSNGVWTIDSLGSQQSVTLTFTGLITSTMAGTNIINHATETQTEYPPATISDATIHVNKADVAISKTVNGVNRAVVNVGNTITYIITVINKGADDATGLQITDLLPSGLSNLAYTASTGTYSLATGLWNIGSLVNGVTATLTITGKITSAMAGLNITNYANITAQNEYSSLPVVSAADVYTKKADVTITNTANSNNLNVGQTGTFTVTVTNKGPDTATNIRINDVLPSGFTYSTTGGSYDGSVWTIDSLASGDSVTLTYTGVLTASMAGTNIINSATETQNEYPFTVTVSDATIHVKRANVALSQTGSYSRNKVTFIVKATNNGPDAATNINIKDLIPTGLTGASVKVSVGTYDMSTGIWTIPSLANREVAILNITGTVVAQSTVINNATRIAQEEYNSELVTSIASVYVPSVDLRVRNYEWYPNRNNTYSFGESAPYVSYVMNYGPDDATNIVVKYTIGSGFMYQGYSIPMGGIDKVIFDGQNLTYYVNYLPVNGYASIIIYLQVNATGNQTAALTTNASLVSVDQIESGSRANFETKRFIVANAADIQVTQDTITYNSTDKTGVIRIHVRNNGPNTATNINVNDNLPAGMIYTGHTTGESYNSGIWHIDTLASGNSKTLEIYFNVTATSGTMVNTATKTNSAPYDWNYADDTQTMHLTLTGTYAPTVDLRVRNYEWYPNRNNTYNFGESAPYVSYVMNYGPGTATNIVVKYTIGSGFMYQGYSIPMGGIDKVIFDGQNLTYYVNYLPVNGYASIIIYLQVNATGNQTAALTTNASLVSVDQIESGSRANFETKRFIVANAADIQVTQNINGSCEVQTNNGQDIVLTVTVTNNGPNTCNNITIEDLLTGLTYVDNDGGAVYSSGKLTWNISALGRGESITLHITVKAESIGTYKPFASKKGPTTPYDWNYADDAQTAYIIRT